MSESTNALSSNCNHCTKPDASKRCSKCKTAWYCSSECQTADWASHKIECIPETIVGIVIHCDGEKRNSQTGLFSTVEIGRTHRIHSLGDVCPVSKIVGLPIVMYRHLQEDPLNMRRSEALDNQIATYLMINPVEGFAPPRWQSNVGSVTVMRKDGKPLTYAAIETIWMYHDHILDLFGDDPAEARAAINRQSFKDYCESYKDERLLNGHREFRDMPVPI